LHAISILIYILTTESFSVNLVQEYKKQSNKQTNSVSAQQTNIFNRKGKKIRKQVKGLDQGQKSKPVEKLGVRSSP